MRLKLNKLVAYLSVGSSGDFYSHSSFSFGVGFSVLSKSILVLGFCLISLSICTSTSVAATNINSSLIDVNVIRSISGRYTVAGTNSIWNASVMRRMEALAVKVERITGLKTSFRSRRIRVRIADQSSGGSGVTWAQGYKQSQFSQKLNINDYLNVDTAELDLVMCGLFLNGYVFSRQLDSKLKVAGWKPDSVPSWLALGVARNLYSSDRAENSSKVLAMYDNGELPSVEQLLNQFTDSEQALKLDSHLCGMFVLWLSRLSGKAAVFDQLFSSIADNELLIADNFIMMIKGCNSASALERMWVDWIYKQRRVVYEPGVTTSGMVEKLESMLVVTPVECLAAKGPAVSWNVSFGELILSRKESWVAYCARQKIISLKLVFIGRGSNLVDVIDLYCDFLSALEKGKSEKHLTKLLKKAEESKNLMLQRYGDQGLVE